MCYEHVSAGIGPQTIPVDEAIGMVLAHDITEIRQGEFKGRVFRKGHIVTKDDIPHLKRLGKEHLFILEVADDEMHENDAVKTLALSLAGPGVTCSEEPNEGKLNLLAAYDGLLKINKQALKAFNMTGEVMCATLHENTVVQKGQIVAGTRAIPLLIKKSVVQGASSAASGSGPVVQVLELRKPKVGVVITGNEVYKGIIKDGFAPIIKRKIAAFQGEIIGIHYCPDDEAAIEEQLQSLLDDGADFLITTGGMSVDPDDVTRFAVRQLGAHEMHYGSPVLPGAMFLVAYIANKTNGTSHEIPILGIPACGLYHNATIFDLVLPRLLAGEKITRDELAEMGHGGLCRRCEECRYPVCPFGK